MRGSRVHDVVAAVLDRIIDGTYDEAGPLPAQAELAAELGVSRLTVREAMTVLHDRRIVRVVQGMGTYVTPVSSWTDVDAIRRAMGAHGIDAAVSLVEARALIEVGAAWLCASRRTDDNLARMRSELVALEEAHASGDVEAFALHDLGFHQAILAGAANPFLAVLMEPISAVLVDARRDTSSVSDIRLAAQVFHHRIYDAVEAGDAEAARQAMESHLDQTSQDIRTHLG